MQDPEYQYTDVGGAYIGPTQRRVARMAKELGLEFYTVNEEQKTIMNVKVWTYISSVILTQYFNLDFRSTKSSICCCYTVNSQNPIKLSVKNVGQIALEIYWRPFN